jgi:lipoprotein
MKKFYLPILALALSVALTACGNVKKESTIENSDESSAETSVTSELSEETTEINTEAFAEQATEVLSYQTCTVDNVSFMVDSSWKPLNGHEGTFATPDEKNVYQLQGVSSLGSYTPEEFFQHLKDIYSESNEIVRSDDTLTSFVTSDNLESYIGRIDMKVNGIFFSIDVLIVPQKNKVVTFAGQSPSENDLSVDVRDITKTASFNIAAGDYISGNTFIAKDGSELCLGSDGEFIYYQSEEDHNKPYCTGTYEVYYGQEAFDKLSTMEEYGLTKEELEETLSANMNGYKLGGFNISDFINSDDYYESDDIYQICKDSFYAVILHNEKLVDSGSTSDMGNDTLYIGFYISELEYADMLNVMTANYAGWTLKGQTE